MSRRSTPAQDRAAQNQQTIKSLLKLEGNKTCADCKRNKHPRWASWNLGIFVCIRCSGIHRGMGTHISRVKSVDLDAWTDEQLQSVLRWGNSRANKYWEAKLAPGHVPSEAKMENFIRTKYESKRWVMDGPMPDPSTLDADGDDDVPLNIVQEKAKMERSASQRITSAPSQPPAPARRPAQNIDLFGDENSSPPIRPSTTDNVRSQPQAAPAPTKQTRPGDSLLGLDFFGSSQPANPRPSSAAANPLANNASRPDLKQSILSLYASTPKPAPAPEPQHARAPSLAGSGSSQPQTKDAFGGLNDAFSGLSFPSSNPVTSPPVQSKPPAFFGVGAGAAAPAKPSAFSNMGSIGPSQSTKAAPSAPKISSPPLGVGSFFDPNPKPVLQQRSPPARQASNGLDFSFTQSPVTSQPPPAAPAPQSPLSASNNLFDLSSPVPPPAPPPTKVSSPTPKTISAFNISSPPPHPQPMSKPLPPVSSSSNPMFSNDPWNDNAWSTPDPPSAPALAPAKPRAPSIKSPPAHITPSDFGGWDAPSPPATKPQQTVAADEDFGGWTSASTTQTPVATTGGQAPKPSGGFGGGDDLFSNVWE